MAQRLRDLGSMGGEGTPWGKIGIGAGVIALILLLLFLLTRGGDADEPLDQGLQSAVMCLPEEEIGASAGTATVSTPASTGASPAPGGGTQPPRMVGGRELFF